ncbi:TonB-dependent receptor [uncultured Sphingopyxis sp.]|uniref:TonB-dependent receptor n=1 Tax=uncultured Sphingopyxis sp. TaxID=310581 RepID=A0A1Y5PPC7_9SPHN|nr:TonB-dependent receptor [uncultured Sphingopyxis sp.]SBV31831.1 TonB-dependent receptor [uncultured Sphingopyxis sp.]
MIYPFERNSIRKLLGSASAFGLGLALLPAVAAAQEVAPQAEEKSPASDTTIIVTGTRRTGVTVADSPTPIDVVSSEQLTRQAATDTNDLLRVAVPSLNVTNFTTAGYAFAIRPFSLRGLSPDQTLVLVNSKRRHRSAVVQLSRLPLSSGAQGPDLSLIPSIAIARVEVLRDGAAAQYGSDAIAGVINFQLREDDGGIQLDAKYGQYYEGDGENYDIQANVGLPLGEGFINVSGQYSGNEHTYRGTQRPDAAAIAAATGGTIADPAQPIGDPKNELASLFVNSEIPLGESVTLYGFGNYAWHDSLATQFYRVPGGPNIRNSMYRSIPLTTTPGGARFSFATLYPEGLLPTQRYVVQDQSVTVGVRGDIAEGLDYDLSGNLAKDSAKMSVFDTINPSLGPTAPTSYYVGTQIQKEEQLHADFVYEWAKGPFTEPVTFAFGAEYRRETFIMRAGEPDSYRAGPFARVYDPDAPGSTPATPVYVGLEIGASAFPGIQPAQAGKWSRSNKAFYGDVEFEPLKDLSLGFAGRYEHFSDFGGTFNWKVSGRFEIVDGLALRGSYNTGFRAPTPGQSHVSARSTSIDIPTGELRNVATVPVDTPVAAYYGATPLRPEKSKNFSAGAVVDLGADFLFTLDYFHIKLRDRIGVTSNIPISAADRTALTARGIDVSDLNAIAFFTNAFDTTTQGFDAVASKSFHWGDVRFDVNGALNYTKTDLDRITFPLAVDRERSVEIASYYPKWRGTLTGVAQKGAFSVMTRLNYYGKYTDAVANVPDAASFDQTYEAELLVDLELRYELNDNFELAIGGSNILDNYPGKERIPAIKNFGFIYPINSPFGFNGGSWYARTRIKF